MLFLQISYHQLSKGILDLAIIRLMYRVESEPFDTEPL